MQDIRSNITQKILMALVRRNVEQETIDEVRTLLEVELSRYEVQERCTDIVPVDNTPFEYLQQFLNVKRIEGKSDTTIKRYKYEIERLLVYLHKPLEDVTTDDLRLYLDHMKCHSEKPLSNCTVDNMRKVFSPFFVWLTSERIISWNPCLALHQIKYRKNIRKNYSQVDMQKLRESSTTIRDTALLDWLSSTGCRVGEVATTQLSMIDWTERSCIVIGKGNKERKVYFDDVTAMHLQMYLNTREDVVDALFLGRSGKPLTIGGIQQAIKRIGNRAGVVKTHCHRFRHTLATSLSQKMPVTEVASILGHDDISTTQVYVHSDPSTIMADYKRAMA